MERCWILVLLVVELFCSHAATAQSATQEPTCIMTEETKPGTGAPFTRLKCEGVQTFNFSRLRWSSSQSALFVGASSVLWKMDKNLIRLDTASTANAARRQQCLDNCKLCYSNASRTPALLFCKTPGSTSTNLPCPAWRLGYCENWMNIVNIVAGAGNTEHLLTCGTSYALGNTSMCQIRSMSNFSRVTDQFEATLSHTSSVPDSHIALGTTAGGGINATGQVIGPIFSVGNLGGHYLFRFDPISSEGDLHNFDDLHMDIVMRQGSARLSPPLLDFQQRFPRLQVDNLNGFFDPGHRSRFVLQYRYGSHIYILAATSGITADGVNSFGSFIWRYCVNDNQSQIYVASLQAVRIACTGTTSMTGFESRVFQTTSTSRWYMRQIVSAKEISSTNQPAGGDPKPFILAAFRTLEGVPLATAVCAYNKDGIRAAFDNNPGRDYTVPNACSATGSSQWPNCPANVNLNFAGKFSFINVDVIQHPLFPRTPSLVPPREPIIYRQGFSFNKAMYGEYLSSGYVVASTADGRIFRMVASRPPDFGKSLQFHLVDEFTVGEGESDGRAGDVVVQDIEVMTSAAPALLAIATIRSLYTHPLPACTSYTSCSDCLGLSLGVMPYHGDFSCVWCRTLQKCGLRGLTCADTEFPQFPTAVSACPSGIAVPIPVTLSAQPANTTVYRRDVAQFFCSANSSSAVSIVWRRLGSRVNLVIDGTKYVTRLASRPNQYSGYLDIANVSAADGGSYVCVFTDGSSELATNPGVLNVRPYFTMAPRNAVVFRTQAVVMQCLAEGYPSSTYEWLKGSMVVNARPDLYPSATIARAGNEIVFTVANVLDSGLYRCMATNTAGSDVSATATVQIIDAEPTDSFMLTPAVGERVVLSCPMSGATYIWYFDGLQLNNETDQNVTLPSVTTASRGRYICQQGQASYQFFIYIRSAPVIQTPPADTTVSGGAVLELTCLIDTAVFPTSLVQWTRVRPSFGSDPEVLVPSANVLFMADNRILFIPLTRGNDSGTYICNASNTVGTISASAVVVVNGLLKIETCPENSMLTEGASSVSFTCIASGGMDATLLFVRNSANISSGGAYLVDTTFNAATLTHRSTLTIKAPIAADAGTYECIARHGTASTSCRFFLARTGGPVDEVSPSTPETTVIGVSIGCFLGGTFLGSIVIILVKRRPLEGGRRASHSLHAENCTAEVIQERRDPIPNNKVPLDSPDSGVGPPPPTYGRGVSTVTDVSRLSLTPSNGNGSNSSLHTRNSRNSPAVTPMQNVQSPISAISEKSFGIPGGHEGTFQRQTSKV